MTMTETHSDEGWAISRLAASIESLATAITQHALALNASGAPKGPPGPPNAVGGRPAASGKTLQQKMAGKVFAICMDDTRKWDIAEVGQQILGRPVGADSRKWTEADLTTVLDFMKNEWSVG